VSVQSWARLLYKRRYLYFLHVLAHFSSGSFFPPKHNEQTIEYKFDYPCHNFHYLCQLLKRWYDYQVTPRLHVPVTASDSHLENFKKMDSPLLAVA
jgi:hypothetical protein